MTAFILILGFFALIACGLKIYAIERGLRVYDADIAQTVHEVKLLSYWRSNVVQGAGEPETVKYTS